MTENCLTQDQLDRLAARTLRGRELADALAHLETCEHCRRCVTLPAAAEILARFGSEAESEIPAETKEQTSEEINQIPGKSAVEEDRKREFEDFLSRIRARRDDT